MTQETRQVFGISPGVPTNERHYVFLGVVGEVVGGKLSLLRDARETFPTEGNVFVDKAFWVPEGVGAIWRVQHTRTAVDGTRQAEYSAVARGQILPLEIVSITQRSDAPEAVREQLLQGQDLGYVPASSILVQLGDGPVVGPVRCEALSLEDGFGFRCRPDSLNELLGSWPDAAALDAVSFFDQERVARRFTARLTLPPPESYFDCAPLDHVVRAILKVVSEAAALPNDLNKRQRDALARMVAELNPTARMAGRIRRVFSALEDHAMTQLSLEGLREHLLHDPIVQRELEGVRDQARTDAAAQLLREQRSVKDSITTLSSQRDNLTVQIDGLKAKVRRAEEEVEATVERVAANIRERVAEAIQDPASLLSEIALMRHFIGHDRSPAIANHDAELRRVVGPPPTIAIETRAALLSALEQNLIAAGLVGASAKRLAREVLASAQAGQATIFSGSLSNELARASAAVFGGENVYEYRVPIGLVSDSDVARHLRTAVETSEHQNTLVALILEGMNRSAFESYSEEIRTYVVSQQLPGSDKRGGVIILGTLCRGPSALPVTPGLCEIGPVIDTDCLTLGTKPPPAIQAGGLTRDGWLELSKRGEPHGRKGGVDETLQRAVEGEDSILWRRVIHNAYDYLASIEALGGSTPLQSLAFGWLVPRARSCGVARERFFASLFDQTCVGEDADPRLKRLLLRLYPEPQPE